MKIATYLSSHNFYFIDKVNYSTNAQVIRTVSFKRLTGRNSSSGKVTYFKSGTVSYSLICREPEFREPKYLEARYTSLEKLESRLLLLFG